MAKKDFSKRPNPVMQFITPPEAVAAPVVDEPVIIEERLVPVKPAKADGPERKTKRLNLLLQPSVLADITKIATMRRTSVNDLINVVLRAYAEGEGETIRKYEETFEA